MPSPLTALSAGETFSCQLAASAALFSPLCLMTSEVLQGFHGQLQMWQSRAELPQSDGFLPRLEAQALIAAPLWSLCSGGDAFFRFNLSKAHVSSFNRETAENETGNYDSPD